jgi:hypothetical protein
MNVCRWSPGGGFLIADQADEYVLTVAGLKGREPFFVRGRSMFI